ncbi:uncharacterized protein M421DRAFT_423210 [Didymella exigua CBS 183.55]|uniref:Mediator of RNA polymerase II transcription subunit 13 n=1 Tax=Didymella exigua CBS 183.55 TaxID=1150837 RepID=A0A6A5RE10_9PLEO|nr:uncharacterized protein M421DRAFT_423210 [Didymella exigua CBS 183.55]KAF1925922.1 hypothetical protein M421DRAFT_423210 [Didymella exigua CBS 183.55]
MDFPALCTTNAHLIVRGASLGPDLHPHPPSLTDPQGDFEAVAYQAFSVARDPAQPAPSLRHGSPSEDTRAVEAELRRRRLFIVRDATRPWLWLFAPTATTTTTTDADARAGPADLPAVDGYLFQREQAGLTKALELARPPLSARYPSAAARSTPTASLPGAAEHPPPPPPPDCVAIYGLFTSSVVALITLELVRECAVTSLNCRTFVSQPLQHTRELGSSRKPRWLTSLDLHWASSGALVVSTLTERTTDLCCLGHVSSGRKLDALLGTCVRVAPNGMLARIMSFDDPLQPTAEDPAQRPRRKRQRRTNLEQSVDRWKKTVKRWLAWKGYSLPGLDNSSAWVRLRTTFNSQPAAASSLLLCSDQDVLWPMALCYYHEPSSDAMPTAAADGPPTATDSALRWFETADSPGFRDPYHVAQDWFAGKPARDKAAAQRRAKAAKEDALHRKDGALHHRDGALHHRDGALHRRDGALHHRDDALHRKDDALHRRDDALHRKEENPGLHPSSPLNTRIGAYGELQPATGVYPTPPDGVAPGASVFAGDTPSVAGAASNVILAPGGKKNPAIALSAPQDNAQAETPQQTLTWTASATDSRHCTAADGRHCTAADGRHCTAADGHHCTAADGRHCTAADGRHCTAADGHHCTAADDHHCTAADDHHFTATDNDDLFGDDMDEDAYQENDIDEDDFDFFDPPNDGDVDMADAPATSDAKADVVLAAEKHDPIADAKAGDKDEAFDATAEDKDDAFDDAFVDKDDAFVDKDDAFVDKDDAFVDKDDAFDALAALEKALATAATDQPPADSTLVKEEQMLPAVVAIEQGAPNPDSDSNGETHAEKAPLKAPTPPLSPNKIRDALKPSPKTALTLHIPQAQAQDRGSAFGPLSFSRKMSVSDAKYQDGRRYGARADSEAKDKSPPATEPVRPKSLRDVPLLTKLRCAVAVASAGSLSKITPSIQGVNDDSVSESDSDSMSSDVSDEDDGELPPALPTSFTAGSIVSAKRKLPTDGNATPLSVTSFADSLGGDLLELQNLHLDDNSLLTFEPSSWDWSLLKLPPPVEKPSIGSRYTMPLFPHPIGQVPDTPTSPSEMGFDMAEEKPPSGSDSINIAQMVAEQIVSATLDILGDDSAIPPQYASRPSTELRWAAVIKGLFPKAVDCTLPALAAVNDVFPDMSAHPKGQQRVPARTPNDPAATPGSQIYPINPPFIRVRRADTPWDLLPPAVAFWEPLGLAPVHGPKNVAAFCIYPHSDSLRPCLESFLLHMQLAYDSCKLGSHARVETVSEYESGLVPCRLPTPAAPRAVYTALRDTCIHLGKTLAARHAHVRETLGERLDAFIIYMVDPFDSPLALWELCASFWTLFQTYGQGSAHPSLPQKPDLVLQIIPIKYIASFDHPVILSSTTYINLAREVYGRCPPSTEPNDKTPLPIASAPAFQLEEPIPRNVPFKLQSDPPQDLLKENSYMHLAYAISLDGAWLTAAWTDSCGKSQATSTYHLGTRPFKELAQEVWATTISILQARKVHWRVCIARAGVMDREELESWVYLISCPTVLNLFITLLTVDTNPNYKFTPPSAAAGSQSIPNTPAATPGVSPDATLGLTPAATPSSAEPPDPTQDPDARLVDVTDETWGVILAHRLHNSNSTTHFSPALISGLLVKRGPSPAAAGASAPDFPREYGPVTVAVNILWIGAVGSTRAASPFPPTPGGTESPAPSTVAPAAPQTPSLSPPQHTSSLMWTPTPQTRATAENLLKEILAQFRALGVLARLKGERGSRWGTVPWHVGAARRGVEGVSRVTGGR